MTPRRPVPSPRDPSRYETGEWGTPLRPCPSEHTLAAHVDGELSGAAAREVEAHLDGCASCAAQHRRIEGLSGLLRAWDQGPAAVEPPGRLHARVLRDVAPGADVLRVETVRATRWTWAAAAAAVAAVVLGAGIGAAGASRAARVPPFDPAAVARVATALPFDLGARVPVEVPALPLATPVLDGAPERLRAAAPPVEADPVYRDAAGAQAVAGLLPHLATQRRLGEAVCVVDGRAVPSWALPAWTRARRLDGWIAERARLATEPRTRDPLASGRALADVVPLPAQDQVASFLRTAAGAIDPPSPGRGGVVVTALSRPASAPAVGPSVGDPLDLAEAVAAGRARLLPDGGEGAASLAVEVAPGAVPVYVPAGEIVEGGAGDRVVAHGAWIAPGDAARVVRLPCVAVSRGGPRAAGRPLPTGLVAGPQVRSLLARGEPDEVVLAAVEGLLRGAALTGPVESARTSLVALHRTPPGAPWDVEVRAAVLVRALGPSACGFVAADPSGRFQGVEHTDLDGAARTRLLGRLLAGYLAESRARSRTDAPRMGVQTETALVRLAEPSVRLLSRGAPEGVRVTGEDPRTGVVLEGLAAADGAALVVSGFVPDVAQGSER